MAAKRSETGKLRSALRAELEAERLTNAVKKSPAQIDRTGGDIMDSITSSAP